MKSVGTGDFSRRVNERGYLSISKMSVHVTKNGVFLIYFWDSYSEVQGMRTGRLETELKNRISLL